jgi:integrase-like protein
LAGVAAQLDPDVLPRWCDRPIASIRRQEVSELLGAIESRGAPVEANRTLARLKTLFAWAVREELIDSVEKLIPEGPRPRADRS